MFYKNTSYSEKTFYGVTFKPGETKEVDGYINNKWMILKDGPTTATVNVQQKPSPAKPKKEVPSPIQEEKKAPEVPKEEPKEPEQPEKQDEKKEQKA